MRALLALVVASCAAPEPALRARGPLPDGAYVWQRAWDGDVREAVSHADAVAPGLGDLVALGAEIDWDAPAPLVRVDVDPAALADSGLPWTLALRIGPRPRILPEDTARVVAAARDLAARSPSGIQLDFDAGRGQLAAYRGWVEAIAAAVSPVRVTLTALPDWLASDDLPPLLDAADGWILQVHAFTPPADGGAPPPLVDPAAALAAVERAAALRRPFRVALPTHAWTVVRDASGRFVGIRGERGDPDGERIGADPVALAALVRSWTLDRPAELIGVTWFRLPTAGDRLAWPPATLAAVRAGRVPRAELRVVLRGTAPTDVAVSATGEAEALVGDVVVHGSVLAADALPGFTVRTTGSSAVFTPVRPTRVRPGERRPVGWVRAAGGIAATEERPHGIR